MDTHPPYILIGEKLRAAGLTLVTAESCTGGLIGHLLTEVPGSSDYFLGGAVSYSNELKMALLGVKEETLIAHGAVSGQTAVEMAAGARSRFQADIGVSVTGIAGPGGATEEKPLGLTYIGLSTPWGDSFREFVWKKDRSGNKLDSANAALHYVLDALKENAP